QSRSRPPAVDHGGDVDPPADRAADASLLLDQRVEGASGRARPAARPRADRAGLVLRRRPRRCARSDDRPRILPPDRRSRALALSPRAQAWRPPAAWLELRRPLSPCEVRQPLAAQALRLRPARDRPPTGAARLPADHRAAAGRPRTPF